MRLLAAMAACVLALGLPRLLVACTSDGDASHLEWTHAEGACCAHEHGQRADHAERAARSAASRDLPSADANESCEHVELAIELGPTPRSDAPVLPPPAPTAAVELLPANATSRRQGRFRVPTTGPPRRDAPVSLRSTTLLRS